MFTCQTVTHMHIALAKTHRPNANWDVTTKWNKHRERKRERARDMYLVILPCHAMTASQHLHQNSKLLGNRPVFVDSVNQCTSGKHLAHSHIHNNDASNSTFIMKTILYYIFCWTAGHKLKTLKKNI